MTQLRLKHFSSVIRTTDPNDPLLNFLLTQIDRSSKAAAIITNTFDSLEHHVLAIWPPIYDVGPLHLAATHLRLNNKLQQMSSSLWSEDPSCLKWLDSKPINSVLYMTFSSIAVLSPQLLSEFTWGLVGSETSFVWIVRPDLVWGEDATLPPEFWEEIGGREFACGWCPQEETLSHPAVGGFLTHCGWNSILEGVCNGVPMLYGIFFVDQHVNCKYACEEWGIGMEIKRDVERDQVGFLVRELMNGDKGEKLRKMAGEWQEKAAAAVARGGSSCFNLDKLVSQVLSV